MRAVSVSRPKQLERLVAQISPVTLCSHCSTSATTYGSRSTALTLFVSLLMRRLMLDMCFLNVPPISLRRRSPDSPTGGKTQRLMMKFLRRPADVFLERTPLPLRISPQIKDRTAMSLWQAVQTHAAPTLLQSHHCWGKITMCDKYWSRHLGILILVTWVGRKIWRTSRVLPARAVLTLGPN